MGATFLVRHWHEEVTNVQVRTDDLNSGTKVYVYLPSDLYAMGWVGCGDYRIEGGAIHNTIGVYSHTITNEKYAVATAFQHNMLMSTNPKRAIKNALAHLRPYRPEELAKLFAYDVATKVSQNDYVNKNKVNEAESSVTKHKQLYTELSALVSSGYEFVDADFGSKVTSFISEVDEYNLQATDINMYYVRAYMLNDEQVFDTHLVTEAHNTWRYEISPDPTRRYTSDTLPEFLSGKLSVLMMCDLDQYVEGVGIRMNDGVFYVNQ